MQGALGQEQVEYSAMPTLTEYCAPFPIVALVYVIRKRKCMPPLHSLLPDFRIYLMTSMRQL